MKNSSNKVLYLAQAAMIAAISPQAPAPVITTCLFFIKLQVLYQPFSAGTSEHPVLHVPR